MPAKIVHLGGPPQNIANENQKHQNHDELVILNVTGLDQPKRPAHGPDKPSDELHHAVHDPAVPPSRTKCAFNGRPRRTVHGAVNDCRIELPQSGAGTLSTVHKEEVVTLIDVILVQKNGIQRSVLPHLALLFPASLAVF